jgi:hypothetical protein
VGCSSGVFDLELGFIPEHPKLSANYSVSIAIFGTFTVISVLYIHLGTCPEISPASVKPPFPNPELIEPSASVFEACICVETGAI